MLKLTLQIEEKEENQVHVRIKQISKKEFDSSTQNEKITASEIKHAIDYAIKELKEKTKKEEEK